MHAKPNAKWHLLILAFAAASSWMLAENCHRIDLGAPDDDIVATAPATCSDAHGGYGWIEPTIVSIDEGFQVARDNAGPVPDDCSRD